MKDQIGLPAKPQSPSEFQRLRSFLADPVAWGEALLKDRDCVALGVEIELG